MFCSSPDCFESPEAGEASQRLTKRGLFGQGLVTHTATKRLCQLIQWLVIFILFSYTHLLTAQSMWVWNQRTHPELVWETLETEHFKIHYHHGIESIAQRSATIAEQAYQPTLDQLQLAPFGKIDIILSAEDEIMNGFAMPSNQMFIWVSQNDAAGHFTGSDKWLKMVITHELQHVAQFEAHRTWAGIFGGASIPLWWFEGMAEYMTEVWRVGRSDSRMKLHTYRNSMERLDSHDDGFAKVLYLAWKYGDSTLVEISKHRLYLQKKAKKYPYWYDFKTAFKAATGQSLEEFDEEWRRVMNTYYYGYKSQKETPGEIGDPFVLPGFARIRSVMISPDSTKIAVTGRQHVEMRDEGIYIKTTTPASTYREIHYGRFSGRPTWSPDSKQLITAEYHRGEHGSLIYDLRLIDTDTGSTNWITQNLRATHPVFSQDGQGVFFVAHPGETSQIYFHEIGSGKQQQVTQFIGDIQIRHLDLSPRGDQLAFMIQDVDGAVDIAIINTDGSGFEKITNDPEEDNLPLWTTDGAAIIFTSYRNSTPNLYRVEIDSLKIIQMTDVAEGIYSRQRIPKSGMIMASTLADVDTIRIRTVRPDRVAPELGLNIREPFKGWRTKSPDIRLPALDHTMSSPVTDQRKYQALDTVRPLVKVFWPLPDALLLLGVASDALGKHFFQVGGIFPYLDDRYGAYVSYSNLKYLPSLHFFWMKDLSLSYSSTYRYNFLEHKNGVGMSAAIPMNLGNKLSSNHHFKWDFMFMTREVLEIDEINHSVTSSIPATPLSEEFNLGVTYVWKSQRPHTDKFFLPREGVGFLAHAEVASPEIWGENDYSQYWIEGFYVFEIPELPFIVYGRLKYAGQSGDILLQDELGFSEAGPLYFSTEYMATIRSTGLVDGPESYSLRGLKGQYPATDLIYSTTEIRMPILDRLPVNVFGFGLKNITGDIFYDTGYIPASHDYLETYGGEFKFDISFSDFSLVTLAYGWGGDINYWRNLNEGDAADFWSGSYLRMALVNPF